MLKFMIPLILLIFLTGCVAHTALYREYNDEVAKVNVVREQHNRLVRQINANRDNITAYIEQLKEYDVWADDALVKFGAFKKYVADNKESLNLIIQELHYDNIEPDMIIADINQIEQTINENKAILNDFLGTQSQ